MSRSTATGAAALKGSKPAKQALVVILETLSGLCPTGEAAERLSVSLSRYYQLETRALQGMLTALEPRARGRQKTPLTEIRALKEQKRSLERELRRHQGLLRAATRSVGARPLKKRAAKKRGRQARGKTVLKTLKEAVAEGVGDGTQERGGRAAASARGQ